jgi:hypothetical protein
MTVHESALKLPVVALLALASLAVGGRRAAAMCAQCQGDNRLCTTL